jgi:transposase
VLIVRGGRQGRLDDFFARSVLTATEAEPASVDQTRVSPIPKSSTAVTSLGTVVRIDSERSTARTAFERYSLGTDSPLTLLAGRLNNYGLNVGIPVGVKVKYRPVVGIHVGQQERQTMGDMLSRQERGLRLLARGGTVAEGQDHRNFLVASERGQGRYHAVREANGWTCDCPDFVERQAPCKHIFAVQYQIGELPLPGSVSGRLVAPRPRRRDLRAWQRSQLEEGRLLPVFLRDLVDSLDEPPTDPHKRGQKGLPAKEKLFCALLKVYSLRSCRKSNTALAGAAERGQLARVPSFHVSSKFLLKPESTPLLRELLVRSATPLAGVEEQFAVDSTGLRTTSFNYYNTEVHAPSRKNVWMKIHTLIGVRTHVVVASVVTDGYGADSPRFPELLRTATASGFRLREVSADKAYLSRDNFAVADELGVVPFIPFKSNSTAVAKGTPLYHRMFHYFQMNREEFDQHYHKRSNVESLYGSLKQTLGETLRSKRWHSRENEALAKIVLHNIQVLIRQMFETGLVPDFIQPYRHPVPDAQQKLLIPQSTLFPNSIEPESAVSQFGFAG